MGLFGGIISGAMSGAGTAGLQQQDTQQKLQGSLYNAEQLAQMNAELEVVKAGKLQDLKQAFIDKNFPESSAQNPVQSSPSVAAPAPSTSASVDPVIAKAISDAGSPITPQGPQGLDMSKVTPQQLAAIQKDQKINDPTGQGIANGVTDFQTTSQPNKTFPAPTGFSINPPATQSPQATTWMPSRGLMRQAQIAEYISPGLGAKTFEINAPNETGRMSIAQGRMPGTPGYMVDQAAAQEKANSQVMRPGGMIMSHGKLISSTPDASGIYYSQNPDGSLQPQMADGYGALKGASAGAIKAGELSATNPLTIAPPDARPVDPQGRSIPVSIASALDSGGGAQGAGNAPGIITGKEGQQKSLNDKWSALNTQNQQAQTTTSYLQNIKGLAAKAAVGPMSDRIDFANGLLSILPDATGSKKNATDAVTANDLLDKYQGQIIARLGQGGMGTDSARALLASAYPGSHMNLPAINEAVDNLVGANDMVKAKAALLAPHAANLDPVTYQQNELKFDQNADPRIWQWKNIQNPAQKSAFATSIMKQDPSFPSKIDALEKIGAL